jgi:DNA-binding transcriptional MerR regulator
MSGYTIQQFSSITGFNKILLRTWENRYTFLVPHRTSTNIRYYDDDMIVKALNIRTLMNNGVKVSKINKLSANEILNSVKELYENDFIDSSVDYFISKMVEATLNFDKIIFDKVFELGVKEMGVLAFYRLVILPTLHKIGYLWLSRYLSPSQEHFLSEQIKIKISHAISSSNVLQTKDTWLLFLPENEFHDIALQFAHLILTLEGCKVLYLGPNLPLDSLEDLKDKIKIQNILYFNLSNQSMNKAQKNVKVLIDIFPNANQFLVLHSQYKDNIEKHPKLTILTEIDDLLRVVR